MSELEARPHIEPITLPKVSKVGAARRAVGSTAVIGSMMTRVTIDRFRRRGVKGPELYGRHLRRALEKQGPTYVKLGQLLASSPTLAGEALADELRGLLDKGRGIPMAQLRAIVEADTGKKFDDLFADFDDTPHAAASLAVVHKATLRDGRRVAVKVLRPGAMESIAADLSLLVPLFNGIARWFPIGTMASLPGALHGLAEQLAEELDLRNEARTMGWFAAMLEVVGVDGVVVPEVVAEGSGRRVITMGFIEGEVVDDLAAVDELGIDARAATESLLRAWFAVTLCTGTFHGDMHAGNLLFAPDGRVALLDWGILGRMEDASWMFLRRSIEGAMGDDEAWIDVRTHIMGTVGADVARMTGMTEDQVFDLIKSQIMAIMTEPFEKLNLLALMPTTGVSLDGEPTMPTPQGPREFLKMAKAERKRLAGIEGPPPAAPPHGEMLMVKQLIYFERYGRLFLSGSPLIWDEAVFKDLLALPYELSG